MIVLGTKRKNDAGQLISGATGQLWQFKNINSPIGQWDAFDGIMTIINLVLCFKYNSKATFPKAMYWLEVSKVPWCETLWWVRSWFRIAPVCMNVFMLHNYWNRFLHDNNFLRILSTEQKINWRNKYEENTISFIINWIVHIEF